jgi:hypothetical protein
MVVGRVLYVDVLSAVMCQRCWSFDAGVFRGERHSVQDFTMRSVSCDGRTKTTRRYSRLDEAGACTRQEQP